MTKMLVNAKLLTPQGNAELGAMIRGVAGRNVSAAEKVRLLTEGGSKVKGVTFNRVWYKNSSGSLGREKLSLDE